MPCEQERYRLITRLTDQIHGLHNQVPSMSQAEHLRKEGKIDEMSVVGKVLSNSPHTAHNLGARLASPVVVAIAPFRCS